MSSTPRAILFEDTILPKYAHLIDVMTNRLELPEETKSWFFHFSVCVGIQKTDQSDAVILHSERALDAFQKISIKTRGSLQKQFSDDDFTSVLEDWRNTLITMVRIAQSKEACTWTGDATKEEISDFPRKLKNMQKFFEIQERKNNDSED